MPGKSEFDLRHDKAKRYVELLNGNHLIDTKKRDLFVVLAQAHGLLLSDLVDMLTMRYAGHTLRSIVLDFGKNLSEADVRNIEMTFVRIANGEWD